MIEALRTKAGQAARTLTAVITVLLAMTAATAQAYTVTMETLTYYEDETTPSSEIGGTAVIRTGWYPQTYITTPWTYDANKENVCAVAIPALGYKFKEWQVSNDHGGSDAELGSLNNAETSINKMYANATLTAVFVALPQWDLPGAESDGNVTLSMEGIYKISGDMVINGNLIIQNHAIFDFDEEDGVLSSSLTVNGEVSISGSNLLEFFSSRVLVYSNFGASPKQVATILDNPQYNSQGKIDALSGKTFAGISSGIRLVKTTDGDMQVNNKESDNADFVLDDDDDYFCFVVTGDDDNVSLKWDGYLVVDAFNNSSGDARFTVTNATTGDAVSVTYDYEDDPEGEGYLSGNHSGGASFTMPSNSDVTVSARACVAVSYMDGDGNSQLCRDYTLLPTDGSDESFYGDSSLGLGSGWYVSKGVTVSSGFKLWFASNSEVHLILCDGTTTSVCLESNMFPLSCSTLTVYGQSAGTGVLTLASMASTDKYAINAGSLTICGGSVSATSSSTDAINANEDIILKGGTLTANATNGTSYAIECRNLALSGGKVVATTGTISATGGATIANGLTYTDGTTTYTTSITNSALLALGAVTLRPDGQTLGKINYTQGTGDGGTLTFYSDASCTEALTVGTALSSLGEDHTVYIKATPDAIHLLPAATDITVEKTTSTMTARRRDPGTGETVDVSTTATTGVYSFVMPADANVNVSVTATFPDKDYVTGLDYIGFEGVADNTGTVMKVYVLDGSETVLGLSGETVWYVSNTSNGITFNNDVTLAGDVCIILADGSAMTVQRSISGAGKSLCLYGQEGSTGSLDFESIACNDVTITGGIISSENTDGNVIDCSNNIVITGGQVTIPSSNSGYGSLVASGDRIYLGWTLPTDCYNIGIYAASLIALQDTKRFVAYDAATGTAATAVLSNSVSKDSEEHYSSINGKWLRPVNGNIVTPGSGISVGTLSGTTFSAATPDFTISDTPYYIYSAGSKVNMNYTGQFGTDDKSVTYTVTDATLDDYDYFGGTNGTHQNAEGRLASFTMPANDVTASASLNPFTQPGGYCGKSNVNNGKNLVWTVTDVGTGSNQVRTLTISKNPDDSAISGQTNFNMADYRNDNSDNFAPWIKPNAAGNGSDGLKYPITTVTIADGVTSIGDEAFDNCSGLQNVTIGNNVTTIGSQAFEFCSGLQIVTIGNSVTSIGNQAFDYCSGLQKVNIGNSVTKIGGCAFRGCEELQEVSIGSSVTTIGDHAFERCIKLQNVTIPASVTTIGRDAFHDGRNLTVVTMLPSTPPSLIGDPLGYSNLKLILVPDETAYAAYNSAGEGWNGKISADFTTTPEDITFKSLLAPNEISLAKNTSGWGTYCHSYPVSYSLSEGATAYTLNGLNDAKTAVTTTATTGNIVAPFTPLLLNYTAPDNNTETDDENVTLTALPATATTDSYGAIVSNGGTGCTFYGNATGTTLMHDPNSDPDDGIPALIGGWPTYILRNGTFVLVDTDEGIPAHRCVLSVGSSNAARVLTIGTGDETTGIEELKNGRIEELKWAGAWYSLDGRKLDMQPTKKGLYIYNGKKTVIK